MARPRCKRREAALTKLETFKNAHPHKPVPPSLLTYFDEKGVRRYTVSGHDARKASVSAAERYLATVRARRNELRLRIALDVVPMICFEWDIIEDKVRRLDPQKLDLSSSGGKFDHFRAVLNAVHPDDRARFHSDVHRALEKPEVDFRSEVRIINADGSVSWFREQGFVERDARGRPLRLIGIAVDVTGHKGAQASSLL
jgi:PAS domain-containing protein